MNWFSDFGIICAAIAIALILLPPSIDPAILLREWLEKKRRGK